MALLVQRVSGSVYGRYFFPQVAGVGYSFNPYAWNRGIDPRAGVVRLVFGLGTWAVDRSDDDYTRVIALNLLQQRPESDFEAVKRHTQRRVDVIDLEHNNSRSVDFFDLAPEVSREHALPLSRFAVRDHRAERDAAAIGLGRRPQWVLTFDELLQDRGFVDDLRHMLETLEDARAPVVVTSFENRSKGVQYLLHCLEKLLLSAVAKLHLLQHIFHVAHARTSSAVRLGIRPS